MMKTKTKIFFAATLALCAFAGAAIAADPLINLKKRSPAAGPTVITSSALEFNYRDFIALFDGNVKVADPQFTLTADKMLVFFENTNEVKRVDAVGRVVLVSGDMTATAGKATYTAKNAQVLIQSNIEAGEPPPVVTKGENRISGKQITVWLNEDRVNVINDVILETTPSATGNDKN